MKSIALIVGLVLSAILSAQVNIIPAPADVQMGSGTHTLKYPLQIVYDESAKRSAEFLASYLEKFYNVKNKLIPSTSNNPDAYALLLKINNVERKGQYELKIDKGLSIAGDEEGVFYGVQSFIQLLTPHV